LKDSNTILYTDFQTVDYNCQSFESKHTHTVKNDFPPGALQ
jgi:hypothetical protein